jgi:transcriptional regulator with XRE-family HTH domain
MIKECKPRKGGTGMQGKRIKQLRLAKGLSLDDLAKATGKAVSKQALSKYERDLMQPSSRTLVAIASALGVQPSRVLAEPQITTEFIAYRKGSGLAKKEQQRVQNLVSVSLEKRVRLQELTDQDYCINIPIKEWQVNAIEEAEESANQLRKRWNVGVDPISSMMVLLESRLIHVMEIDASKKFDGISAYVVDEEGQKKAACVVTRRGINGERQRLSLAHELGHLCMETSDEIDEEIAAFRFGSAFLAPADLVHCVVGKNRYEVPLEELKIIKQQLGMSMQAILHRLHDLHVINSAEYKRKRALFKKLDWETEEPNESVSEKPTWYQKALIRAAAEGLISPHEVAEIGIAPDDFFTEAQKKRLAMLRTDKKERSKMLTAITETISEETDIEFDDFEIDDDFFDE